MKSGHAGLFLSFALLSALAANALAAEDVATSTAELTARAKKSLVAIRQGGRAGGEEGVGSGFVVKEGGLIATNFHVIGEGRSILVELPDGTEKPAMEVHAWDRTLDLAIIRIDDGDLPALPLAEGNAPLPDGTRVIALGAPQGLRASVVEGVVSARRDLPELPDVPMLQIAMPIEPGNSGGPVLSMDGHVQGLVTLRSMRTPNLGFAMPASAIRVLLEKPNPMPIERWRDDRRARCAALGIDRRRLVAARRRDSCGRTWTGLRRENVVPSARAGRGRIVRYLGAREAR